MKIIDKSGNLSEYKVSTFKVDWSRVFLIIISLVYLLIYSWLGGWAGFIRMFYCLIIPFCCVWFSEVMGDYKGIVMSWPIAITKTSPGGIICISGWLVYIALGFILIYWKINKLI